MKILKSSGLLYLLLASSVWASKIPIKSNSSYGGTPTGLTPFCLDGNGNPLVSCLGTPAISGQEFPSSNISGEYVFDYQINDLSVSGFSMEVSVSDVGEQFDDFGAFLVQPGATDCAGDGLMPPPSPAYTVFCGPDPSILVPQSSVNATTPPTVTNVTFNVPGNGDGLVFFVLEPAQSSGDAPDAPTVKIGPPTLVTPEPGSLILLASAMLVLFGAGDQLLRGSARSKWRAVYHGAFRL
jgi:hypothetical protein